MGLTDQAGRSGWNWFHCQVFGTEMILLERLPLRPSVRYAITTLSQYVLILIGFLVVCASLGLTWVQVQFVVAALGVGIGFGLQEIVANFICGIILLFEQPIRVGDLVTVGDTTGTVRKIPNLLVVGERERAAETVALRRYGVREQRTLHIDEFEAWLLEQIETRAR